VKAILLAAGKGERLRSILKTIPKPMVKVYGKPILEHNIEWLKSYGITDLYINLHFLPEKIRDYFNNGRKWGVKIDYSYEPELLGTAGAVKKIARELWGWGSKNFSSDMGTFLVVYGDNLLKYNLKEIIDFHFQKKGIATIVLYEKDDVSQSGIAVLSDKGRIIKFIEKPKPEESISNLVNTGIYVLNSEILSYIPDEGFTDFGNDIFPAIIKGRGDLYGFISKGSLIAIDTPELYKLVLEGAEL